MTADQKRLLAVAAIVVAAYCAGAYRLRLHSPCDAFGLAEGTESKTLEFGKRTRSYLIHRSFNDVPATDIMWSPPKARWDYKPIDRCALHAPSAWARGDPSSLPGTPDWHAARYMLLDKVAFHIALEYTIQPGKSQSRGEYYLPRTVPESTAIWEA